MHLQINNEHLKYPEHIEKLAIPRDISITNIFKSWNITDMLYPKSLCKQSFKSKGKLRINLLRMFIGFLSYLNILLKKLVF